MPRHPAPCLFEPGATALLGMPGALVTTAKVKPLRGGGRMAWVHATETPCAKAWRQCGPCPGCECRPHGGRVGLLDSLAHGTRYTRIKLQRAHWRCANDNRELLASPFTSLGLTARAIEDLTLAALQAPFLQVEESTGVDRRLVGRVFGLFLDKVQRHYRPAAVSHLGFDGVNRLGETFTVIAYPRKGGPVLDVLKEYTAAAIMEWLERQPWTRKVKRFVIDPDPELWLAIKRFNPDAVIILDKRHVIAWLHEALRAVRNDFLPERNLETPEDGGRARDPLRHALECRPARLSPEQAALLDAAFARFPLLRVARDLVEAFINIYDSRNRAEALARYNAWRRSVPPVLFKYFQTIIDHLEPVFPGMRIEEGQPVRMGWSEPFFAYFDNRLRLTTGYIEAVNRGLKDFVDDARGKSAHARLRAQILFAHGGITENQVRTWAREIAADHPLLEAA